MERIPGSFSESEVVRLFTRVINQQEEKRKRMELKTDEGCQWLGATGTLCSDQVNTTIRFGQVKARLCAHHAIVVSRVGMQAAEEHIAWMK